MFTILQCSVISLASLIWMNPLLLKMGVLMEELEAKRFILHSFTLFYTLLHTFTLIYIVLHSFYIVLVVELKMIFLFEFSFIIMLYLGIKCLLYINLNFYTNLLQFVNYNVDIMSINPMPINMSKYQFYHVNFITNFYFKLITIQIFQ